MPVSPLPAQNPRAMAPREALFTGSRGPALLSTLLQVLREPRFLPERVVAGHDLPAGPCHPPAPPPCTSLAFHPPSPSPQSVSLGQCSPDSPAFPAARGEHLPANGRGRRAPKGDGRSARAAPRADGVSRPKAGTKGKPLAPKRLAAGGRAAAPPAGTARDPGTAGASPRGHGSGARRAPPAWGRPSQVPAAGAPHPARPGAPARALAPTVQKPRAEAAPPGPGPGCRRRAHSAPLPPGRRAPPGAQARPGPGAAAAPAPPPLQRPPPPAPPVAAAERPSRRLWRAAGRVASAPAI